MVPVTKDNMIMLTPIKKYFFLYYWSDAQLGLGLQSGMLVAVPIPDQHEAEGSAIQAAIDQALEEAR